MAESKLEKITTAQLVSGFAGMICPIPIVGEALLTCFIYPTIKQMEYLENQNQQILLHHFV
jgi:hypothetical protein